MNRPRLRDYPADDDYVDDLEKYCDELEELAKNYHKALYNLYKKHLLEAEPYKSHYSEDDLDKLINNLIDNAVEKIKE